MKEIDLKEIDQLNEKEILSEDIFLKVLEEQDEVFKTTQIIELQDRAKALGVKTKFDRLLEAYQKEMKKFNQNQLQNQPTSLERKTEFDNPEYTQEMVCGNWIADGNGVRTFNPWGGMILACYHPIMPVQRLINAETGKEKIKLAYQKGGKWKDLIVDKGVIASANKIVGLADYGISVTSETSKNLVRFLADIENFNIDQIEIKISTSKLGWIDGDFMPYGKNIVFDSETKFKSTYESIREEGSEEVWMNLVKKIRKSDRLEPQIYLIGSLASVLIEPLNALPFLLNLWGDTGKGKTVAMMLATSVWANPGGNEYMTDPKATVTALELRLDFLNNMPMLIDDMAQLKDKYGGDFSELVYMLCSGKGKDRANASLGLNKSTTWKNVILTNGEHSLVTETMQGGAINRIIDVEIEEGYIFKNGNYVVETIKQNFGFCGPRFIDAINQIGFDHIKAMQEEFLDKINKRAEELGVEKEEKQTLPMSILLTADKIATDYIFEDGVYLDFNVCVDLLKNKGEISEHERAYEFIMSEVAININKFKPDDAGNYKGEVWGFIHEEYVNIATNVFNKMAKDGNFSSRAFCSWADRQGIIEHDKDRWTKKRRMGDVTNNYYSLKMESYRNAKDGFLQITEKEQEMLPFL